MKPYHKAVLAAIQALTGRGLVWAVRRQLGKPVRQKEHQEEAQSEIGAHLEEVTSRLNQLMADTADVVEPTVTMPDLISVVLRVVKAADPLYQIVLYDCGDRLGGVADDPDLLAIAQVDVDFSRSPQPGVNVHPNNFVLSGVAREQDRQICQALRLVCEILYARNEIGTEFEVCIRVSAGHSELEITVLTDPNIVGAYADFVVDPEGRSVRRKMTW